MTLNYYKLEDDGLSEGDRIVYSLLCTAFHFKKDFPSANHFRDVTGFRHSSIMASLHVLRKRGWITDDKPVQPQDQRFEKITIVEGVNVKQQVFYHVVKQMSAVSTRTLGPSYWSKVFGVSRRHATRLLKKMASGWQPSVSVTDAKQVCPSDAVKPKPIVAKTPSAIASPKSDCDISSALIIGFDYALESYTRDEIRAHWVSKGRTAEWIDNKLCKSSERKGESL